jgi:hypothetical protein
MKAWMLVAVVFLLVGCQRDPRVPLDCALRDINDIRAHQLQSIHLRPLQDDFEQALARDTRVRNPAAAFFFGASGETSHGARLVVRYVALLELRKDMLPSTEPAELDKYVQDLVRNAFAQCGWQVEDVDTYCYENKWRIVGQARGQGKAESAGIGLDILPPNPPGEQK